MLSFDETKSAYKHPTDRLLFEIKIAFKYGLITF